MLTPVFRSWLIGGWLAVVALTVVVSVAMDAKLSTTAFLLALGVAPALVIMLIAGGASAPTVAQILHSVDTKEGRP